MEFRSNSAGLVAKVLDCRFPTASEHFIQALLDVALGQSARNAMAGAGPPHVLQKCPRWGSEAQAANEKPVARQRWRSPAWAQGHSRQNDVAFVIGDEKYRAVRRRAVLQRGAVGDEGARQVSRDQRPKIAQHDLFWRVFEIAGVEARPELAQGPSLDLSRDGCGEIRIGDENLGHG